MKQAPPPGSFPATDAFRRVLGAYEARGFDTAAIRQWCIPELDAEMLVEATRARRPKRILEVGTYVGVSTLLMAMAEPDAAIVTIDPDLPLAAEMGSMQSDLGHLERGASTHAVARAAARELGVEERIRFVAGGFAIGDTFSSIRSDPEARVPVVGPGVCRELGPFDLIFIDGLHYASAVEADLRLAAEALAPGGLILMHDCIGMWGTNVRAGIFRFLADNPSFRLSHPRFGELYRSIGTLFRADEHPELMQRFRTSEPDAATVRAATNSTASSIVRRLEPDFVLELACEAGAVGPVLEAAGVPAASITVSPEGGRWRLDSALAKLDEAWQGATGRNRLLMSFGLLDQLPEDQLRHLLGRIKERDILAAFGFTPPGEDGIAGPNSRSLRHMARLVDAAGLSIAAPSRFDADPVQFAFTVGGNERVKTSYCLYSALVGSKRRIAEAERKSDAPVFVIGETQAEAFEQENLLRLHYSRGFRWAFHELSASRALISAREEAERASQAHIAELSAQIHEGAAVGEDLRRQVREQLSRADDLERQIASYDAALAERGQVEADLRRQIAAEQERSTGLIAQIDAHRDAQDQSNRREKELQRHLDEQVARADNLTRQLSEYASELKARDRTEAELRLQLAPFDDLDRQVAQCRAASEERERVEAELRRHLAEQVARSEDLARQIADYRAALAEREVAEAELRRLFSEQVARSEDLARQIAEHQAAQAEHERAEAELRRLFSEQLARSEGLVRQIADYQAALGERERVEAELRRHLVEQLARSEDLSRQVADYMAALERRDGVETELRRQVREQVARSDDLSRQVLEYRAALAERGGSEPDPARRSLDG